MESHSSNEAAEFAPQTILCETVITASMSHLLVFSTFPDAATARAVARTLVTEKLAACVNLLPGLTSLYVWQGELTESEEVLALLKTPRDRYPALENRLRELHPYGVPEIVAVEFAAGLPAYLQWLDGQTRI